MNFNKALVIAFVIIGIGGFAKYQLGDNGNSKNPQLEEAVIFDVSDYSPPH